MVSNASINDSKDVTICSPKTDQDFLNYYQLRWEVLRKPWGQPKGSEKDSHESNFYHLMAEKSSEVVGVGCIRVLDNDVAQIRFMAVSPKHNKKGVGKMILKGLKEYAGRKKKARIKLYARETAVPFYLKSGYNIIGDGYTFFEVIKHKQMEKTL